MLPLSRRQTLAATLIPFFPFASCVAREALPEGLVSPDLKRAVSNLSPELWPGPVSNDLQKTLAPLMEEVASAMRKRDLAEIHAGVANLSNALGAHLGTPEVLPPYGAPVEYGKPDIKAAAETMARGYKAFATRGPWRDPQQRSASPTFRLRITGRIAEAMIRLHLAGQKEGDFFFKEATKALEYAISVQAPNGVFGYPYIPTGGSAVAREAAALVEQQRSLGKEMVHKGWIIDDLNKGGLEFDNAVIATTLLLANDISPRKDFLESALRAGEWALPRPFVTNINYNTFSAFLFARLYRVTGDKKWIEASKDIFRFVVLPTQLDTGRWIDPHNARIQYHSIILRHGLELLQALVQADDPMQTILTERVRLGLDNLAAQIILFGSSNTDELLATESLVIGEALMGPNALWNHAISVDVNYLMNHFSAKLASRDMPLSPPLALVVQKSLGKTNSNAFELSTARRK